MINPADKQCGVKGYHRDVGICVNCGIQTNCMFDIGTPILVKACSQECADVWWSNQTKELR